MILRAIHIEHWSCIAKLDLPDLPSEILVLYGPNGTGKSSLVRALRGCLFDFDHDTTKVRPYLPWNSAGPPKIAVEFEASGGMYRITKVFSKKVDGLAKLQQKLDGYWRVVQDASKEACAKTRELLGAEKSTLGLNQLLWLDQGEVALPEAGDLDASLEKRLGSVLGVMVTGPDLAFKKALDEHCKQWYTEGGKHKKESPVNIWQKQVEERQENLNKLKEDLQKVEQAILDLKDCTDRLPGLQNDVKKELDNLAALKNERERSEKRLKEYELAAKDQEAAAKEVRDAQTALDKFEKAKERSLNADQEAQKAERTTESSGQEKERLTKEHTKITGELVKARAEEEAHAEKRDEIEARRKLLELSKRRAQAVEDLDKAQGLKESVDGLERKLQGVKAPEETELESLREKRRKVNDLKAKLQAEALTLAFTSQRALALRLEVDSELPQSVELPAQRREEWPLRQHARLELPGLAVVEVFRTQEKVDLKRAEKELAKLDQEYRELVLDFEEKPDDEKCLDRLADRRSERKTNKDSLDKERAALLQAAPEGLGVLENKVKKLDEQQKLIFKRRPELVEWNPTDAEIEEWEKSFQERLAELQKTRKAQEAAEKIALQNKQTAEDEYQNRRGESVAARTTANNRSEELKRLGEEPALGEALQKAKDTFARAQQRLDAAQLDEHEKTIKQRYKDAETALKLRQDRLNELQGEIERHRGRLEMSEGLHSKLSNAEAELEDAQKTLAQATLAANAHKRLRDLFEECRNRRVQCVMGPIEKRVLEWAEFVGLREYRQFRFGDQFLPEGVVVRTDQSAQPRSLQEESYGIGEQLSLLVRLALGGVLAKDEPQLAILDDPLAHADRLKHERVLEILSRASKGVVDSDPPAGPLQILILTCHPDRFDHLPGAMQINLAERISRES